MKNRREKKAQPWFPGTPNILLPNRHPEDGVRRGERRPAGQGACRAVREDPETCSLPCLLSGPEQVWVNLS